MAVTRESLRRELNQLQARMRRYEEFKSYQYNTEICVQGEHEFDLLQAEEMEHEAGWVLYKRCRHCGIEVIDRCPLEDETIIDNWAEFREGDEEE